MSRAHTNDKGDLARVVGQEPLMKRVEDVMLRSQVRRREDFMVHAARSCWVRVRVLRPRRLLARSVWEVSFSWLSALRISNELMRSI